MSLAPYRNILAVPGVKALLFGGLLARVPCAAMGLTLTLYVRFGLDMGYFDAGVVGALFVIGAAIGSTAHGRIADKYGIRTVLLLSSISMGLFWISAVAMSYPVLAILALPAGLMNLPVFVVIRQPLAVLINEEQRRTAYALDSTIVELAFMTGPAAATILVTMTKPWVMLVAIGIWAPLAGMLLWWINPKTRTDTTTQPNTRRPTRREWMTAPLIGMLVAGVGATIALGGADMAIVSSLEANGDLSFAWIVMAVWALYSLIGGFLLGITQRPISPLWLLAVLGLATIPLALVGNWWLMALALIPSGMACAPTIAASVDAVSKMVPESVRGEAMGMHGSSITIGTAVGAPLVGWAVDSIGPQTGFIVAGAAAVLTAIAAGILQRAGNRRSTPGSAPEAVPVTA